jgi:hypothetical protein
MDVRISSTWRNGSGWTFRVTNDGKYYVVAFINPEGKRIGCIRYIGLPAGRVKGVNADMSDDELAVRAAIGAAQTYPKDTGAWDKEELARPWMLEWAEVTQATYQGGVFTIEDDPNGAYEAEEKELEYAVDLEPVDE